MGRDDDAVAAWARSGAMTITGRAAGPPLGPPPGFVERIRFLETLLGRQSTRVGAPLEVDALALLGERAALSGLRRAGDRSCGGATRLLRSADGWLAVSLARPSDIELLPAWLGADFAPGDDPWLSLTGALADRDTAALVAAASDLGLPVASLPTGEAGRSAPGWPPGPRGGDGPFDHLPVVASRIGVTPPVPAAGLLVADLSSLWAGPLCAHLLGLAGARVVKVESTHRPDGARFGPRAFFDLLHAGHESVALDFTAREDRELLRCLLDGADVVIESSRPRALHQLGIDAEAVLRAGRPRLWVSITGYGRTGRGAQRVAFGDDGAVAGGLVVWDQAGPCFCADAVADPLTGLVAATAALEALAAGGRWLLDIALQRTAAFFAADTGAAPPRAIAAGCDGTVSTSLGPVPVAPPRARTPTGAAPPLGAHTQPVLAQVRRGRR